MKIMNNTVLNMNGTLMIFLNILQSMSISKSTFVIIFKRNFLYVSKEFSGPLWNQQSIIQCMFIRYLGYFFMYKSEIPCSYYLFPIDYFSLDVEGSELDILKTIPFDMVDIKVSTYTYSWQHETYNLLNKSCNFS